MDKVRLLTIIVVLVSGCISSQGETEAFFCPEDKCEQRVVNAISHAEHSLDAAVYSITSKEIMDALLEARDRGVRVRAVSDYLQSASKSSLVNELNSRGIETRVIPGRTMHNKFLVLDNETVITGSYNWTANADERNDENLAFIFSRETASKYSEEFFELWVEAG